MLTLTSANSKPLTRARKHSGHDLSNASQAGGRVQDSGVPGGGPRRDRSPVLDSLSSS